MVDNYALTKSTSNPNGPDLEVVRNGQSRSPQPGDILSYSSGEFGHTSVVKSAYIDNTGNGSIYVAEENNSDNGISQLPVQNWNVVGNAGTITKWLVGEQYYQPAVQRNQDGRLEVFTRGRDGALYHNWQTCPGCPFSGWFSEGGSLRGNPAVIRHQNGVLEVFARWADGFIYKKYQTCAGCGWSGWERWGGDVKFQGSPTAIVNGSNQAYVFGWGADNQIWYSWRNYATGAWSAWIAIPSIATANPSVALDNRDPNSSRVTVFHRGTDMVPYYSQQGCSSCGFGGWTSLGGTLDGPPAVGTTSGGWMVAFALGTDTSGVLYRNSQQWDGTWGGWVSVGGTVSRGPVVANNANGALEVYAIQGGSTTYQNKLFRKSQLDNWLNWVQIGNENWHVGLPGVGRNLDGRLEIFARQDGSANGQGTRPMYNMWQNSANGLTWSCCGNILGDWP